MNRVIFFLLCLLPVLANGQMPQQEYESLRARLAMLQPGNEKLDLLHRLAKGIRDQKTKEALAWVNQEIDLARELNNDTALAKGLVSKGWIVSHLGNIEDGLALYQQGFVLSEEQNTDCISGNACNMLGGAYQGLGDMENSIAYYLKALKHFDICNKPTGAAVIHNNLASMYMADGNDNLDFAINHLQKARIILEELKDSMRLCALHLNYAEAYGKRNASQKVEYHLQEALIFSQARKALIFRGSVLTSLGSFYLDSERQEKGVQVLKQAIATNLEIQDRQKCIGPLVELAAYHLTAGEIEEARGYADQALSWANEFALPQYVQEANWILSQLSALEGDSAQAYIHYQQYSNARDSVLSKQRIQSVKQLQFKYETALREQELVTVKADSERKHLVLVFSLIGLALALVTGAALFYANIKRKKANQLLSEQRDQLEQRNLEKEALLKEIHHRVKNNLQVITSLLDLQSNSITDEAALHAIQEGQSRVKSIAMIHQKLYQTEDLAHVGFQDYATQLINFLSGTFRVAGKDIDTVVQANNIQLDIDTAVPLGLILNELVTNAYKYAFTDQKTGMIRVALQHEADAYKFVVSDNGRGLPEGFDVAQTTSLGIKLVHILTRQLDGTVISENKGGACFTIRFKEKEQV